MSGYVHEIRRHRVEEDGPRVCLDCAVRFDWPGAVGRVGGSCLGSEAARAWLAAWDAEWRFQVEVAWGERQLRAPVGGRRPYGPDSPTPKVLRSEIVRVERMARGEPWGIPAKKRGEEP